MLWTAGGALAHELIAAALIGAGFLTVFALAEVWKRAAEPPVEWTRKFVHFFGGLLAATFPWVFSHRGTVVALALVFAAIIWGTRRFGLLQSVHGVERRSEGGLFYPLAVLVVFMVGHDRPVFYLIAILVLVVSDTLAALLGSTYGRQMYTVESDRRSLEGSAVFFLTTFLATHLPLVLMAGVDPMLSVLIGLQVAIIVTQLEAISLRGNDNLLVPIATFYLLLKMTPRGVDHMAGQIAAQLVIIALIGVVAWRMKSLTLSGAFALMLFAYGAWGLGGPEWVVAPGMALLVFLGLRLLFARGLPAPPAPYQVLATFYVCIVASVLFIANNTLETLIPWAHAALRWGDPLYTPFVGVVAAQLALLVIAQLQPLRRRPAPQWRAVAASLAASFAMVVPAGLAAGPDGVTGYGLALSAAIMAAATLLYLGVLTGGRWPVAPPWNVRLQALSTAVAAAMAVPVQLWWVGAF
jgi:dolichol kinase